MIAVIQHFWRCVLVMVTLLAVGCTPQAAGTIDPSRHSSIYTDPKLGWSWRYPSN